MTVRISRAALKRGAGFSLRPSDLTVKKLASFRHLLRGSSAFDNKKLNYILVIAKHFLWLIHAPALTP